MIILSVEFYNHPHKPLDHTIMCINDYEQKKNIPHDFTERLDSDYVSSLKNNVFSIDVSIPVDDIKKHEDESI